MLRHEHRTTRWRSRCARPEFKSYPLATHVRRRKCCLPPRVGTWQVKQSKQPPGRLASGISRDRIESLSVICGAKAAVSASLGLNWLRLAHRGGRVTAAATAGIDPTGPGHDLDVDVLMA